MWNEKQGVCVSGGIDESATRHTRRTTANRPGTQRSPDTPKATHHTRIHNTQPLCTDTDSAQSQTHE
jgi:hypothetical protein